MILCGIAGVVALALGAWTSKAGTLRPRRALPHDVHSAMFALEMLRPKELSRLEDIVHSPEEGAAGPGLTPRKESQQILDALKIDFAFIPAYATFLVSVGFLAARSKARQDHEPRGEFAAAYRPLGFVIIACAVGAAVSDVRENNAIISLMQHGFSSPMPRGPSLAKWSLLFVAVFCIAPTLIDRKAHPFRRWVGYLGAFVSLATAVEGVYGVANQIDRVIESAGSRLALAFLLTWIFVTTAQTLREGLLPALDRLAELPLLRDLTQWPSPDEGKGVGTPVKEPERP